MNDLTLLTAIASLMDRCHALGVRPAVIGNHHFGPLIIPSAGPTFAIPRLYMEEDVATGPAIGGFPTFRTAPLSNILDITETDLAAQAEISDRILTITTAQRDATTAARQHARRLADEGHSVSSAIATAASQSGVFHVLIEHEFHHREIHKNLPRSRWQKNAAPVSGDGT